MIEKISRDTKLDAVIMNVKGVKQVDIAASLGISESTIKRAKARDRKYGDVEGGYKKCGRKSLFGPCMRDVISAIVYSVTNLWLRRYWLWFTRYLMQLWKNMRKD